ncbi:MAG: ubiquinone/menaquinone biosynthesis C-methylase UbiE [Myxococcota bacterium]|jgi:ubiquinone/menaquinone biosynthesis C-methylase UbiE
MKLNKFEFRLLTGRLRCWVQEYFDNRQWRKLEALACADGHALDIGCGQGYGLQLAIKRFGLSSIDGIDIDERMLDLSAAKTKALTQVTLRQESATNISATDNSYDIAFDYQVLHHITDWRAAVNEIHRVLKPGAQLLIAESLSGFINDSFWGKLMQHPREDRFDAGGLQDALSEAGFLLSEPRTIGTYFVWLVATKA